MLKGPVVFVSATVEVDDDSPMIACTTACPEHASSAVMSTPFINAMAAFILNKPEPQLS